MKLAVAFAGAFLALAVTGPTVLNTSAPLSRDQLSAVAVPAWLNLPSHPFISSVEFSGEVGVESSFGSVAYALPSDGAAEVEWLKQHLIADGYQIEDRTSSMDNFVGADAVISATQASTGRRVMFVRTQTLDGADLRLSFEDPLAGTQLSEL